MLVVQKLSKKYGSFLAINEITFQIKAGEAVALLGPNGAGKSTTMRIICGAMQASSGHVYMNQEELDISKLKQKRLLGFLPEHPPLYLDMRLVDYLHYVCELKKVAKHNIKSYVEAAIDLCQLGDMQNKIVGNLSKGYKQRLGIAQAMVHKPKLIVLDEPTVGLDPQQVTEIRKVLKDLAKTRTLLISSHILSEVESICKRAIIINKGKVIQDKQIDTANSTDLESLIIVTKDIKSISESELKKIAGYKGLKFVDSNIHLQKPADVSLNPLLKKLIEAGIEIQDLQKVRKNLEATYLEAIKK